MMDEKTALTGTTTTITTTTKEKKRYTPLVVLFTFSITLLLVGLAFYAGQPIHGGTSLAAAAGGGGGTTRGASTAVASLTMVLNEAESMGHPTCVKSEGTYDSQKDYCYTCGGVQVDNGVSTDLKIGYCWNSQHLQCIPACGNVQGVSGIGDNQCGDACDGFLTGKNVPLTSKQFQKLQVGPSF